MNSYSTSWWSLLTNRPPVRMKGWVGLVRWPTADGVYPYTVNGHPSAADQWKFAGQRPTFYHWATHPTYTQQTIRHTYISAASVAPYNELVPSVPLHLHIHYVCHRSSCVSAQTHTQTDRHSFSFTLYYYDQQHIIRVELWGFLCRSKYIHSNHSRQTVKQTLTDINRRQIIAIW